MLMMKVDGSGIGSAYDKVDVVELVVLMIKLKWNC